VRNLFALLELKFIIPHLHAAAVKANAPTHLQTDSNKTLMVYGTS